MCEKCTIKNERFIAYTSWTALNDYVIVWYRDILGWVAVGSWLILLSLHRCFIFKYLAQAG